MWLARPGLDLGLSPTDYLVDLNTTAKRACSLGCGSFSPSANQRLVITPRGDLITRYQLTSHLSLEPSLISTTTVVP